MNKALAVQSARMRPSSVGRVASGVGIKSAMMKNLHTTADKKANLDPRVYHKKDEGKIEGSRTEHSAAPSCMVFD